MINEKTNKQTNKEDMLLTDLHAWWYFGPKSQRWEKFITAIRKIVSMKKRFKREKAQC